MTNRRRHTAAATRRRLFPTRVARVAPAAASLLAAASLAACASAAPRDPAAHAQEVAAASLCMPPAIDSTAFRRMNRGGYTVGVPRSYSAHGTGGYADGLELLSGGGTGRIVMLDGNFPMLFNDGAEDTMVKETCTAMIDGRPVELVAITYNIASRALEAPGATTGLRFVVGARWAGAVGGRDVAMWIDTKSPATSRRLRGMFWTVRFASDTAKAADTR